MQKLKNMLLPAMAVMLMTGCLSETGGSENTQDDVGASSELRSLPEGDAVNAELLANDFPKYEVSEESELSSQVDDAYYDLKSVGAVKAVADVVIPELAAKSEVSSRAFNPNYSAGCFEIQQNLTYTWTPAVGGQACVYVAMPEDAVTTFFALDQNANRQVNLSVVDDLNGNNSYVGAGGVVSSGTSDLYTIYTEDGHYYIILTDVAGDGGSVRFGAAVNTTNVDQYEDVGITPSYSGNDAVFYSFPYGTFQEYHAALFDNSDVDTYKMTSNNGQDLEFSFISRTGEGGEYIVELEIGGNWIQVNSNTRYTLTGLAQWTHIPVRVRVANPAVALTSGLYYIVAGSTPMSVEDLTPDGDRAARILSPRVQNHNDFLWAAGVTDSTGNAVRGAQMVFQAETEAGTSLTDFATTDYFGLVGIPAYEKASLPTCTGGRVINTASEPFNLSIRYDLGAYLYRVRAGVNSAVSASSAQKQWAHLCGDYATP